MTSTLARRMDGLRASEIREILKLTRRPEVISFAGGLPAPELFPVSEIKAASELVFDEDGCTALQYSPTEGDPDLRSAIAERMRRLHGTAVTADEILVTTGSQQGLDLTGKVLLDEGDVVLCESPTYLGAIQALRCYQPRFVEVPTDDDGMIIPELVRRLADHDRVKLVYVVPDFQNPTGRSWSTQRRLAFMQLLSQHRITVVEDSPYAELWFENGQRPPLKSLDRLGQVVFLGTFSKILCPGLRVGWLGAPKHLFDTYVLAKQGADLHTSSMDQRLVARFLDHHDIDANIVAIRRSYRGRRDMMLQTMDTVLPPEVRYTRPDGGMFVWVQLPEQINARDLLLRCLEEDVAFVPGGSFFPNGGHENTLRLNFTAMPEERIAEGIRRLARALCRLIEEHPSPTARPTRAACL